MKNILFKPILGYSTYYAGEDGNIYSSYRLSKTDIGLRRLKPGIQSTSRYYIVCLVDDDGKRKTQRVHRLICSSFHGLPYRSSLVCSHKDGNWKNNKPSNLKWETQKENLARRKKHGTSDKGYNNSRALITKIQLRSIRKLLKFGKLTHKEIGNRFNVSRTFVTKIKNNYRYAKQ